MFSLKTLCSNHLSTVVRHQDPSHLLPTSSLSHSTFSVQDFFSSTSSIFLRNFLASAPLLSENFVEKTDSTDSKNNGSVKESEKKKDRNGNKHMKGKVNRDVGLSKLFRKNGYSKEKLKTGEGSINSSLKEIKELKTKLQKLERELESLKGNVQSNEKNKEHKLDREVKRVKGAGHQKVKPQSEPGSLSALFGSNSKSSNSMFLNKSSETKEPIVSKQERVPSIARSKPVKEKRPIKKEDSSDKKEPVVPKHEKVRIVRPKPIKEKSLIKKELSAEMGSLVSRCYEEGYFNKENSSETKELDVSNTLNHYPRDFLRLTAEKFGHDHQEIAKWLSGSDVKTVALFGCPSLEKKSIFAAKRLRSFFRIQEDIVCRSCKLKSACKLVNRRVCDGKDHLNLADVMRVLSSYELDLVNAQLELPTEVKSSVGKLVKEVVSLSQ